MPLIAGCEQMREPRQAYAIESAWQSLQSAHLPAVNDRCQQYAADDTAVQDHLSCWICEVDTALDILLLPAPTQFVHCIQNPLHSQENAVTRTTSLTRNRLRAMQN